jgi:hypothetical protein
MTDDFFPPIHDPKLRRAIPYVGFAPWYDRKRRFPLHQIVWPNSDGLYPWDRVAPNTFKEWQPLFGEAPKSV